MATLQSIGIEMPSSFNALAHDGVNSIVAKHKDSFQRQWGSFASGWNAIAYRFRAATEFDEKFTHSVSRSNSPAHEERYEQDHALFGFFTSAISTIECFFYSAYCIGSVVDQSLFPMTVPRDLVFYPNNVSDKYSLRFPGEAISITMTACVRDTDYQEMLTMRNVLSHRGTPPRTFFRGGEQDGSAKVPSNLGDMSDQWSYDLPVDATTTRKRYDWLSAVLANLHSSIKIFCESHL